MQRVGDLVERRIRRVGRSDKASLLSSNGLNRVVFQSRSFAFQKHFEPVRGKGSRPDSGPGRPERMEVRVAYPSPVAIADAELEGRLDFPHQLIFIDAQLVDKVDDRWDRSFADSDRPDLTGLN